MAKPYSKQFKGKSSASFHNTKSTIFNIDYVKKTKKKHLELTIN